MPHLAWRLLQPTKGWSAACSTARTHHTGPEQARGGADHCGSEPAPTQTRVVRPYLPRPWHTQEAVFAAMFTLARDRPKDSWQMSAAKVVLEGMSNVLVMVNPLISAWDITWHSTYVRT